jgi:integrase
MHLTETRNGWRVIVQYDGHRRSSAGHATRMEAMRRGAALIMELGGQADLTNLTVGELVADYLNDLARHASPKYVDEAERAAERIPAAFQRRRAATVTGLHLDALYRQLGGAVSQSGIRRIHTVLMAAYNRAVKLGALPAAPKVGKPAADVPDVHPPSHEQAKAVLSATTGLDHLTLRLSAVTGCRRGEVVALRWEDVDLERGTLHIRRSLVAAKGAVHLRPTKTGRKGHRKIGLDLPTLALLRKHLAAQAELRLANGLGAPEWVVSDDGVKPWRPDHLTRVFIEARRAAGVEGVRLHDLRHYVATTMLADGEPIATVSQRLGHASVTTTANIYAHWIDDTDSEASERLASRLG